MGRRKGAKAQGLWLCWRAYLLCWVKVSEKFPSGNIYFVWHIECGGLILCLIVFQKSFLLRLVSGGRGWILNLHPCKAAPGTFMDEKKIQAHGVKAGPVAFSTFHDASLAEFHAVGQAFVHAAGAFCRRRCTRSTP